jgi:hypothetical protein
MARFIPCDEAGIPDPKWEWINVPEPSPFPQELRYYSGYDAMHRRMALAKDLVLAGYDYMLMEYEPDTTKIIPIHKLEL